LEVLQQLGEIFERKLHGRNTGWDRDPEPVNLSLLAVLPNVNSPATNLIKSSLPGVNLDHCIYRDQCQEAASSYVIRAEKSGSRTIVNYNELPEMTVEEFSAAAGHLQSLHMGEEEDRTWWHFEVRNKL
jgi:ketohexokinase